MLRQSMRLQMLPSRDDPAFRWYRNVEVGSLGWVISTTSLTAPPTPLRAAGHAVTGRQTEFHCIANE